MTNEIKKLRVEQLLVAVGLGVQQIADELEIPRETVSRTLSFTRPAKAAREQVSKYVGEKARQLIADELAESASG